MDLLQGIRISIDAFYYNLMYSLAGLHWTLVRGVVMMGYSVELINNWLSEQAFISLISQTNAGLQSAVSIAFVIALIVLGVTYMLAAFVKLDVVNPRSALLWYLAGALFFSIGPTLYAGMNDFRLTVAQGMYLSTLNGLESNVGATFNTLDQVQSTDLALGPLCDYLGVYLPDATAPSGIDGLDVSLAYLRADGPDVMGYPYPIFSPGCPVHLFNPTTGDYISSVPQEWHFDDSYFDVLYSPDYFDTLTDEERASSLNMASSSQARLLTAWPLVLFGVVEQMVYLLITIAMGITFLSFGMAILFAFFKKTEVIARSIVDQWIELIVQTVAVAMVQSLVVSFFLIATTSGNGMVVLGIGLICLIFMIIVLWSGIRAVWNAMNRLFGAMGQATGGVMMLPSRAGALQAAATGAVTGKAVSVGSNALAGMTAIRNGATGAQAAGVTFGGSQALTGAARTLAYLPGVRDTSLGQAAEQFSEGSITRQVARNIPVVGRVASPIIGSMLLTDRNPDNDQSMLVPAVGRGLENWTVPRGATSRRSQNSDREYIEDEQGNMIPLPTRPQRMGVFTPQPESETVQQQQRSDYQQEMQGEEMEQHLSDVMRTNTGIASPLTANASQNNASLENSVNQLTQATQMLVGQLRVSGVPDVASVMADVVGQNRANTSQQPLDYLQVGRQMAQVMGVTPQAGQASIQRDLVRFGMFVDQALKLGLSPQQTERIIREVQTSPEGKLSSGTRETLDKQIQTTQNVSWVKARDEVDQLEHTARLLPTEIVAIGAIEVDVNVNASKTDDYQSAMNKNAALDGSNTLKGDA